MLAIALLATAYFAPPMLGWRIEPSQVMAVAVILASGASIGAFLLIALTRPPVGRRSRAALMLNEDPAKEYVFPFRGENIVQITARPDMSVGEMLVRFGDTFKSPPDKLTKTIVVTIKGSPKKPFASMMLQQLFTVLKPYTVEHVLLMNERDDFIGYIPGKRAVKEFSGDKGIEAIDKYVVQVLAKPGECAILRELGGSTNDDTVAENENAFQAQAKLWANEKIQGLVLQRKLRPVGYISKVDVLRINAGLL